MWDNRDIYCAVVLWQCSYEANSAFRTFEVGTYLAQPLQFLMLLGIKWYEFVWNDDVQRLTKQPKLTAIIQSCRLTLFGHIMHMDDSADAKRILLASPPADWRRQLGHRPSCGSAPSNRIWNNTTLRSPKQQIWFRTALCGGWCRHMALRNRELHARNDDDEW